ncbi:hypothetical protein ESCO_004333 [Escovopsis weberi]|uniref:Uncharacterized protein n=1 Tax=Escovopsis weberi TaxID=150374 RepID=A0A0M8N663_ESCWE|nr:hypothetical protein ESCO_004333 [Escovopsis weberi]
MCVFVLDLDGRFDATRLTCAEDDLHHVYVLQPGRVRSADADRGASLVAEAETFMLYSQTAQISRSRQWWGSIVVGGTGTGAGGDLAAGWKGWLRVDREHVPEFAPGTTVEAAYEQRPARQEAVDASGWAATSPWGSLVFHDEA